MKGLTKIFIAASILCLAVSCNEDPEFPGDPGPQEYYLSNQSGHTVSIVHKPSCREMPDSLVLLNGEEFYLHKNDGYYGELPMYVIWFDSQVIYYDGRYMLRLRDLPDDRNFIFTSNYPKKSEYWSYLFTLTAEDYAYAVANGKDMGEPLE